MRILLDHCVPVDLAQHIRGHEVESARGRGWQHLKDGELLDAIADAAVHDVLVTVDASIPFQQLLAERPFALVILRAKSNRVSHLARLVPALHRALKDIEPGEVREIS